MTNNFIIELTVQEIATRFAQNRSETFDHSFTVVSQENAKRFGSIGEAHKWLARHGFMRRTRSKFNSTGYTSSGVNLPGPFTGFSIEQI